MAEFQIEVAQSEFGKGLCGSVVVNFVEHASEIEDYVVDVVPIKGKEDGSWHAVLQFLRIQACSMPWWSFRPWRKSAARRASLKQPAETRWLPEGPGRMEVA